MKEDPENAMAAGPGPYSSFLVWIKPDSYELHQSVTVRPRHSEGSILRPCELSGGFCDVAERFDAGLARQNVERNLIRGIQQKSTLFVRCRALWMRIRACRP